MYSSLIKITNLTTKVKLTGICWVFSQLSPFHLSILLYIFISFLLFYSLTGKKFAEIQTFLINSKTHLLTVFAKCYKKMELVAALLIF